MAQSNQALLSSGYNGFSLNIRFANKKISECKKIEPCSPSSVKFYSNECETLGNKTKTTNQISAYLMSGLNAIFISKCDLQLCRSLSLTSCYCSLVFKENDSGEI